MAQENFLINPPRRMKTRKRNPIGETLITIGANPSRRNPMRKNPENPWFGDPNGHRIAALMRWGKLPKGKVKRYRKRGRPSLTHAPIKRRRKHRVAVAAPTVRRRRKHVAKKHVVRKHRRSGFGRSLGVMRMHTERASGRVRSRVKFPHLAFASGRPGGKEFGHNPLGRSFMRKRKRSRKSNSWFGQPRRHRKAAKKGWRRGHAGVKRRRSSKRRRNNPGVMSNPVRHRRRHRKHSVRRRRRHNPAIGGMLKQFTGGVMDIRGWAPLAVTGAFSAITGAVVPTMLGIANPWAKLGAQTAIAIGGGIVVEKFVDKRHGQAWMIVGVAMVGYQLLKQFVLVPYLPQFAVGLGEYPSYYPNSGYSEGDEVSQQVGAFPSAMGAFPTGMNDYPGVGGDSMGAYPYDGAGY